MKINHILIYEKFPLEKKINKRNIYIIILFFVHCIYLKAHKEDP